MEGFSNNSITTSNISNLVNTDITMSDNNHKNELGGKRHASEIDMEIPQPKKPSTTNSSPQNHEIDNTIEDIVSSYFEILNSELTLRNKSKIEAVSKCKDSILALIKTISSTEQPTTPTTSDQTSVIIGKINALENRIDAFTKAFNPTNDKPPTFANVCNNIYRPKTSPTISTPQIKPKNSDFHVSITNKKYSNSENNALLKSVNTSINPSTLGLKITHVNNKQDKIVVHLETEDDQKTLYNALCASSSSVLKESTIHQKTHLNPKIVILNVPVETQNSEIIESLNNIINFPTLPNTCLFKFLRKSTTKGNTSSVFFEVHPSIFNTVLKRGRIFLGLEPSKIYEAKYALQCFNCGDFGHGSKKCPSTTPVCLFCSQKHDTSSCESKHNASLAVCIHCKNHNSNNSNHPAYSTLCQEFIKHNNAYKSKINYG
jgi:hypothetical protein